MGPIDLHGPDWEAIERMLRLSMNTDLQELAGLATGETRSHQLRGRLDMARDILAFARPDTPSTLTEDDALTGVDPGAGY